MAAINASGVAARDGRRRRRFQVEKSRLPAANDAIQSRPLSPDVNAVIYFNIQQFNGG